MSGEPDPVLTNARREALVIAAAWVAATAYCCTYCYLFGYSRPGRPLDAGDLHLIWGIPSWYLWGVMAPWAVCALFTFWFAGFRMVDDDLGKDRTSELDADIREGGLHE